MAWRIIYEDLSVRDSGDFGVTWADSPKDGCLAVSVNGTPYMGYDRYFRATDTELGEVIAFNNDSETDIRLRYPDADIIRGKTTTTHRFHQVEVMLGRWAPENKPREPFDGWIKDVIGWRAWYGNNTVFDSKTTVWADLPDDGLQVVMLYENWMYAPGKPYRQNLAGQDFYFLAPGPDGRDIITSSNDAEAEIVARYPGAIIKRGSFIAEHRARAILQAAFEALEF